MKVLIVCGGSSPSEELLDKEYKNSDLVIGADSGANHLYNIGLTPHILLGDFDSIDKSVLDSFENSECHIEKFNPEKDFTDTELAIRYAIDKGASSITLLGATGSRLDHTYANIVILQKYNSESVRVEIKDNNNYIMLAKKDVSIEGYKGKTFSVYALGKSVEGLTIKNSKYELENYDLSVDSALGTSNEFVGSRVDISFRSGELLIMQCVD